MTPPANRARAQELDKMTTPAKQTTTTTTATTNPRAGRIVRITGQAALAHARETGCQLHLAESTQTAEDGARDLPFEAAEALVTAGAGERVYAETWVAPLGTGIVETDDRRPARMGGALRRIAQWPDLGGALERWTAQIRREAPADYDAYAEDVAITVDGQVTRNAAAWKSLPMTYRAFGTLLRAWSPLPNRNLARVIADLSTRPIGSRAVGTTVVPVSALSAAANDYLTGHQETRAVPAADDLEFVDGKRVADLWLRTRNVGGRRMVVAPVSNDHARTDGDDLVLIRALETGLAGYLKLGRAIAWRGIDSSEIRVVFPMVAGSDGSAWRGYIAARNSETGARSWSVHAGMFREADGASMAVEVSGRRGVHRGSKILGRMIEAVQAAIATTSDLVKAAGAIFATEIAGDQKKALDRLGYALADSGIDAETMIGIALNIGARKGEALTLGDVLQALAETAAKATTRDEAIILETMAGRMLSGGWDSLGAVGAEQGAAE